MKLQDMPRSHSSAGFFVKQRRRGMALQFMPRSHSSAGVFIGGREHGKALQYLPRSPSSATRFKQTETMEETLQCMHDITTNTGLFSKKVVQGTS